MNAKEATLLVVQAAEIRRKLNEYSQGSLPGKTGTTFLKDTLEQVYISIRKAAIREETSICWNVDPEDEDLRDRLTSILVKDGFTIMEQPSESRVPKKGEYHITRFTMNEIVEITWAAPD